MTAGAAFERVTIERMGQRGEGIAETSAGRIYIPYVLPGEMGLVERQGERGTLIDVLSSSPDRIAPFCRYFGTCGGCAIQQWREAPYADWKRGLLIEALRRAGIAGDVEPLVDAHGAGRRRATFHSRVTASGTVDVGFMRSRAHEIIAIDACPILDPRLAGALAAARAVAQALASSGRPLDIIVAATDTGLDLDLRGHGPLSEKAQARLTAIAARHDLARLSNHGVIVVEREKPVVTIGRARVEPPPGVFRQATAAGEAALAGRTLAALTGAKRVADLFAGLGTFTLRIAESAEVAAYDTEAPALAALDRAARATPELRPVRIETRNLFARPLSADELAGFDAVLLDPPRAGAEAQMQAIAASKLTHVVSIACDAQAFARDAAILAAAGFAAESIVPIDQFRHSAHLEIFAAFRRTAVRPKRRLLG